MAAGAPPTMKRSADSHEARAGGAGARARARHIYSLTAESSSPHAALDRQCVCWHREIRSSWSCRRQYHLQVVTTTSDGVSAWPCVGNQSARQPRSSCGQPTPLRCALGHRTAAWPSGCPRCGTTTTTTRVGEWHASACIAQRRVSKQWSLREALRDIKG